MQMIVICFINIFLSKTRISQSLLLYLTMNFLKSKFFHSCLLILHFEGGVLLKNSGKIIGRWWDTVDIRLADTDFVLWVRWQNMLSVRWTGRRRNSGGQNYLWLQRIGRQCIKETINKFRWLIFKNSGKQNYLRF